MRMQSLNINVQNRKYWLNPSPDRIAVRPLAGWRLEASLVAMPGQLHRLAFPQSLLNQQIRRVGMPSPMQMQIDSRFLLD